MNETSALCPDCAGRGTALYGRLGGIDPNLIRAECHTCGGSGEIEPPDPEPPAVSALPPAARRALLDFLAAVYPAGSAQARLWNAPDGAIAWQAQSALDDFADYAARCAANDDLPAANDNVTLREAA